MELIIAMVILATLMTIGLSSVRSSRATGGWMQAVAAANAYADGAERFARDHNGRFPEGPGSVDWPASTTKISAEGPKAAIVGTTRSYVRTTPEPVQDGRVKLTTTVGPAGATPTITYRVTPDKRGFEIVVTTRDRATCVVHGGEAKPTLRACSKR